jgi:hypothetical protein
MDQKRSGYGANAAAAEIACESAQEMWSPSTQPQLWRPAGQDGEGAEREKNCQASEPIITNQPHREKSVKVFS